MANHGFYMSLLDGQTVIGIKSVIALIDALPFSAHIKDRKLRYVYTNEENKRFYDDFTVPIMTKTFNEVSHLMPWSDAFIQRINVADKTVLETGAVVNLEMELLLDANNRLHIQDMIKAPIMDEKTMTPIAVLTLVQEKAEFVTLDTLFESYCRINHDNIVKLTHEIDPVALFLQHLHVKRFFTKVPTIRQCKTLLALFHYRQRKRVAEKLTISVKTVDSHIEHLKNRLQAATTLADVYQEMQVR